MRRKERFETYVRQPDGDAVVAIILFGEAEDGDTVSRVLGLHEFPVIPRVGERIWTDMFDQRLGGHRALSVFAVDYVLFSTGELQAVEICCEVVSS